MEYGDHIDAVERETAALVKALHGDPQARVPTCPDWTLADLAEHVGGFTAFWTHVLCEGTEHQKTPYTERPADDGAADWFDGLAQSLLEELRSTPPDTKVWTWVPDDQSARFVGRRAAHELAVHRFDAELAAAGAAGPIEPGLAADGIEEMFRMIEVVERLPNPGRHIGRGEGQTLHLHGTDRGDEWLLTLAPGGLQVERRHAKGDLALRGAVSDLELLLYQRPPLGEIERFGEPAVLDTWYGVFTFG